MRRSSILPGIAFVAMASIAGSNAQQPMQRVQVGVLECRGGASVGVIVGSVTNLGCVLRAAGMPEDRYVATIPQGGLHPRLTEESVPGSGGVCPVAGRWASGPFARHRR